MENHNDLFIGVDVGSQSVRCAVVSSKGKILSTSVHPIKTWTPETDFYQQSSNNIWESACVTVKDAMGNYDPKLVKGIGFDATCSLVLLNEKGDPLSISKKGENEQNVIVWMDHRAKKEADYINSLKLPNLKFVGGNISPEMQPPKIMWLKKNLKDSWSNIGSLMDLPDFLTWKATKNPTRSLCSVVCKWLYWADEKRQGWDKDMWEKIGLGDLTHNNFQKIGNSVIAPGENCGTLTEEAAREMGLIMGIPVSSSMIDAHAGGIGVLGCQADGISSDVSTRLAIICGTSSCHMKVSKEAIFVPGIWGPYYSAMVPGFWLNEAGQSAAGSLLDHVIYNHPAYEKIKNSEKHVQAILNDIATSMAKEKQIPLSHLTLDLHIWPDFHGNRSPLADPSLKGMVMGLTLTADLEELVRLYLATIQALAFGTKSIIEAMKSNGHRIESLLLCGGLSKNPLYVQIHADVTGLPAILSQEPEAVLLGSAILGVAAAKHYQKLESCMLAMGGRGNVIKPNSQDKSYYEKKYKVFTSMLELQRKCQTIMSS